MTGRRMVATWAASGAVTPGLLLLALLMTAASCAAPPRPGLKRIVARYSFPPYTGLPDRQVAGGDLRGLEGTAVELLVESSQPLARAVLLLADQEADTPASGQPAAPVRLDMARSSATAFTGRLTLRRSGRYNIEMCAEDGAVARSPDYAIRVQPDHPPRVELVSPPADAVATRRSAVAVAFKATDDFGLGGTQVYYSVDAGQPRLLSARLTGPIPQVGRQVIGRFRLPLHDIDLPEICTVNCFVRVRDGNPAGTGDAESRVLKIRLVRPSEFHLHTVEQARPLIDEARHAWRNQVDAWRLGRDWLERGSGARADPTWTLLQLKQPLAMLAARQVEFHLRELTEKCEQNGMGREFMADRLRAVRGLLARLMAEYSPLAEGLRDVLLKSADETDRSRVKALRGLAVGQIRDHQKAAAIILERVLLRLYDWGDLQACAATLAVLCDQLEGLIKDTEQVAPKVIGVDILDIPDEQMEALLRVGRRQRAVYDAETALEMQMACMIRRAELQGRASVLAPLKAAFGELRRNRVNDRLKQSVFLIENNQTGQVAADQRAALQAMRRVYAELVAAGQKVDLEPPLDLAAPVDEERGLANPEHGDEGR